MVVPGILLPDSVFEGMGEAARVIVAGLEANMQLASACLDADPIADHTWSPARAQDSSWSEREVS